VSPFAIGSSPPPLSQEIRTSLNGARVIGPRAKPRIYKLSPSVPNIALTSKILSISFSAGEYPDAPQETLKSTNVIAATMRHFFHVDQ